MTRKYNEPHKRTRIGCDICKKQTSTEFFEGLVGGELWICDKCYKKIISNPKE